MISDVLLGVLLAVVLIGAVPIVITSWISLIDTVRRRRRWGKP